jgi:hypothetical protein
MGTETAAGAWTAWGGGAGSGRGVLCGAARHARRWACRQGGGSQPCTRRGAAWGASLHLPAVHATPWTRPAVYAWPGQPAWGGGAARAPHKGAMTLPPPSVADPGAAAPPRLARRGAAGCIIGRGARGGKRAKGERWLAWPGLCKGCSPKRRRAAAGSQAQASPSAHRARGRPETAPNCQRGCANKRAAAIGGAGQHARVGRGAWSACSRLGVWRERSRGREARERPRARGKPAANCCGPPRRERAARSAGRAGTRATLLQANLPAARSCAARVARPQASGGGGNKAPARRGGRRRSRARARAPSPATRTATRRPASCRR